MYVNLAYEASEKEKKCFKKIISWHSAFVKFLFYLTYKLFFDSTIVQSIGGTIDKGGTVQCAVIKCSPNTVQEVLGL